MGDNKKQHVIPQFYLRGFSEDGKRLYQFSAKTREKHGVNIKDICTRNYFYDLPEDQNHVFEKFLSGVEDEQNRFLQSILFNVRNGRCNLNDRLTRHELISLVLFMNTRGFSVRKTAVKNITESLNHFLKLYSHSEIYKSKMEGYGSGIKYNPDAITAYVTKEGEAMWHLPLFEGLGPVADFLCDNDFFHLIRIVRDKPVLWKNSFFTTDEPVRYESLVNQTIFGTGLLSPGVVYIMPLANDVLAVIGDDKYTEQMGFEKKYGITNLHTSNEYVTNECIKNYNTIIIQSSHDMVFSIDGNMTLPRLLLKNANTAQIEDSENDSSETE